MDAADKADGFTELSNSNDFAKILAGIALAVVKIREWFNAVDWHKVFEAIGAAHYEALERLAENGWTLPREMMFGVPITLCGKTPAELDDFFTQTLSENNFKLLNEQLDDLVEAPEMQKWASLLEQIRESIIKGNHLITVPALLTILEGYATIHVLRSSAAKNAKNIATQFRDAELHKADVLRSLPAISNLRFLERLFSSVSFSQDPPGGLNRHWVLHGRDECSWTLADALRLVNALGTLKWLWHVRWDAGWGPKEESPP